MNNFDKVVRRRNWIKPITTVFFSISVYLMPLGSSYGQTSTRNLQFPLGIEARFSANFGELRKNHFHSGLDIRTESKIGYPVYAIEDGYIARIFVSPYGFGKAIYIDHPDGTTSVYGHLDHFSEQIDSYVKERQYINESFSLNEFPNKILFPIKKGDLIAYSGNSGSSGGPHLHFEIRDTKSEEILNPLDKDFFRINDDVPPKIKSIIIYQVDTIKGVPIPTILKEVKSNTYNPKDTVLVPKNFLVGIETADYMPNSSNEYFIRTLSVQVDSTPFFNFEMKRFAFYESRYVNSVIDYSLFSKFGREVIRATKDPNNKFSALRNMRSNGTLSFKDTLPHSITTHVTDCNGNSTSFSITVKADGKKENNSKKGYPVYFNKKNIYQKANSKIVIPGEALYQSLLIDYKEIKGLSKYSQTVIVGSKEQPLQKSFDISIKANIPARLQEKAFIAKGSSKNFSSLGGTFENGYLTTSSSEFGSFFATVDTVAPIIKPRFSATQSKKALVGPLTFTVTDDKTGISSYDAYIDNKWVIAEYDPKRNLISIDLDDKRIKKEQEHELELYVSDEMGNTSYYSFTFAF